MRTFYTNQTPRASPSISCLCQPRQISQTHIQYIDVAQTHLIFSIIASLHYNSVMAPQRKRKHGAVEDQQIEQSVAEKQQSIRAFGTISKPSAPDRSVKKTKTRHQRESTPPTSPASNPSVKTDKKRKRAVDNLNDDVFDNSSRSKSVVQKECTEVRNFAPRNKRIRAVAPPTPCDTPSKKAAALFDKMKLDIPTKAIPFALNRNQHAYDTPPSTPKTKDYAAEQLPKELNELVTLQAAFLSALSLYFAHNGTSSPANLNALLPMITKHWKKRAVTLDDLRILLAIDEDDDARFALRDCGRAGICLTRSQPRGRATKGAASCVDEVGLSSRFEDSLVKLWREWVASTPKENRFPNVFINQLSLAEIEKDDCVGKAAPLFARGQQRLADLKASQAASQRGSTMPIAISGEERKVEAAGTRGMSLLDRVLAKQAHTASLPAGPTKQQLERKAALHRIEEIARVLELLAAGRPRCSFSMQSMFQQLQQSLRNPISKEEVERCLGLMAREITPSFVSLVQNGAMTGVVVTKSGKVGLDEIRRWVQVAEA